MAIIRKKRILFAVLAVIVIAFIFTETKKVYGNDEESIIKVIQSIDGYNYPSIQLLDLIALKEFASSFLLIVSWFIFAISAYLLYWTILMPSIVIIPFLISFCSGLLCFYLSRKLDDGR